MVLGFKPLSAYMHVYIFYLHKSQLWSIIINNLTVTLDEIKSNIFEKICVKMDQWKKAKNLWVK